VPAQNYAPRGSGGGRSFRYRSLPVWLQWLLPFGVAAVLVVALVAFVHHQTNDVPQIANTSKSAIVEQNREDTIIVQQQQAPHVVKLKPGQAGGVGLRAAVVKYMSTQVAHGAMPGPVKSSVCHTLMGGTSARQLFRCDVTAADVTYPFDGVVEPAAGAITYCQRVAPPVPSMNVPVSKRCT
jgi:hypothetical protein